MLLRSSPSRLQSEKRKGSREPSELRSIDLVAGLKQLEDLAQKTNLPQKLTEQAWEQIAQKIGQSKSKIENRLAGLRAEDEFMLTTILLGNVEQITPLEQKQWVNWQKYGVPDFLMSVKVPKQFVEGEKPLLQRLFVEVKAPQRTKTTFLLSVEVFERLVRFCQIYSQPLYFAIKMRVGEVGHWFLISAAALSKVSTRVRGRPRGREENCMSVELTDIVKEDLSGMWLSNYAIMVPTGFQVCTVFSDSSESPVLNTEFGNLVRVEARSPNGSKAIEFRPGMNFEDHILDEVLRRLQVGDRTVKKTAEGFEVTNRCANNYWVPFYWIVLDTYLDLREKFEPYVSKTPSAKPTVRYFLDVFSDFDRNLAAGIRGVVWKLSEEGLILPIKMVPQRYNSEKWA